MSAEAPPWLIASLKSHKAVLTLTGCQSITAGPLLTVAEASRGLEGRQAAGSGRKRGGGGSEEEEEVGVGRESGKKKKEIPRQTELSSAELRCQHPRGGRAGSRSSRRPTSHKLVSEAISRSPCG